MQVNQKKKLAIKEAIVDTAIGTAIMAPLNFVIISICFSLSFNALQTTIACTSVLFFIAVARKATVRLYFEKHNDIRRDTNIME
jgi:ABC-type protease/lipase transport system fused ATPase/permease subunit